MLLFIVDYATLPLVGCCIKHRTPSSARQWLKMKWKSKIDQQIWSTKDKGQYHKAYCWDWNRKCATTYKEVQSMVHVSILKHNVKDQSQKV